MKEIDNAILFWLIIGLIISAFNFGVKGFYFLIPTTVWWGLTARLLCKFTKNI